ncbi:MAG: hypothetical protein IJ580_09100 [Prevotella sp.]|nr:hypothetical protein [Prevotella sp.]
MVIEKFETAFYRYDLNEPSDEWNSEPLFLYDDMDEAISAAQATLGKWNKSHPDNTRKKFHISMINVKERLNIFEHTKVYTGNGHTVSENGKGYKAKLQELGYDGYSTEDRDTGRHIYCLFNLNKVSSPRKV